MARIIHYLKDGELRTRLYTDESFAKVAGSSKRRHAKARKKRLDLIESKGCVICTKCKKEKQISQFTKDRKRATGVRGQCKECCSDYYRIKVNQYYHANKDKLIPKRFWYYKKSTHGITKQQYVDALIEQGGICAICKERPIKESLVIDHNHETKAFRGLLCRKCNAALGLLKDSITLLKNASDYLELKGSYG